MEHRKNVPSEAGSSGSSRILSNAAFCASPRRGADDGHTKKFSNSKSKVLMSFSSTASSFLSLSIALPSLTDSFSRLATLCSTLRNLASDIAGRDTSFVMRCHAKQQSITSALICDPEGIVVTFCSLPNRRLEKDHFLILLFRQHSSILRLLLRFGHKRSHRLRLHQSLV